MLEKDLISRSLSRLRSLPNSWWYKIPDPSRCPKCGIIGVASKRPFDVVGCYAGMPWAVEFKTEEAWNLKKDKCLAPHQRAQLVLFAGGGEAVVAVGDKFCMSVTSDGYLKRYDSPLIAFIQSH